MSHFRNLLFVFMMALIPFTSHAGKEVDFNFPQDVSAQALTDLNGDRVPELIISGGITEDARHAVYAYTDDKLTELKSEFGEYNGRLYISEGEESPVLIEICMVETTTYTYYYTFDGKRLGLQHSFCDDNGTYSADGNAVSAQEYAEAMYLQPELDAGREIALPGDAENITEVGGHGI